ncbi:MAG: hypothetical protein ACRD0H_28950, partial [Actinomycetes bacterium]
MIDPSRLDLSDEDTVRQIWELHRVAYVVEAELIGYDGIPPLHETLGELRTCGESFFGVYDEAGLTGAMPWSQPNEPWSPPVPPISPRWPSTEIAASSPPESSRSRPASPQLSWLGTPRPGSHGVRIG